MRIYFPFYRESFSLFKGRFFPYPAGGSFLILPHHHPKNLISSSRKEKRLLFNKPQTSGKTFSGASVPKGILCSYPYLFLPTHPPLLSKLRRDSFCASHPPFHYCSFQPQKSKNSFPQTYYITSNFIHEKSPSLKRISE